MYHMRFKGTPAEMGAKRGRLYRTHGAVFPIRLDSFQTAHGAHSEAILRALFPAVCEEAEAMSHELGISYITFISWMLCMGCCMYNLENSRHAEVRGCTAFAAADTGGVWYGRNNDLPPFLKKTSTSDLYVLPSGRCFILTTSSFINGEEAVNSDGLAVCMTFVMPRLEEIRPGFNSVFAVRYLAEKAASVSEALKLLEPLPVSSPCCILLADKSGAMAAAECAPHKKQIRMPQTLDNGISYIAAANNFTAPGMRPFDNSAGSLYQSQTRLQTVARSLQAVRGSITAPHLADLLSGRHGFMCQYRERDFDTVWSTLCNLGTLALLRAEGNPRRAAYRPDTRLIHS